MGDIIPYTPTTINDQLTTNREQKANLFALCRGAEEEKPHSGLNNQKAELLLILFRGERVKWQCISLSAVMTMQNVVNPTFKEEERVPR